MTTELDSFAAAWIPVFLVPKDIIYTLGSTW